MDFRAALPRAGKAAIPAAALLGEAQPDVAAPTALAVGSAAGTRTAVAKHSPGVNQLARKAVAEEHLPAGEHWLLATHVPGMESARWSWHSHATTSLADRNSVAEGRSGERSVREMHPLRMVEPPDVARLRKHLADEAHCSAAPGCCFRFPVSHCFPDGARYSPSSDESQEPDTAHRLGWPRLLRAR